MKPADVPVIAGEHCIETIYFGAAIDRGAIMKFGRERIGKIAFPASTGAAPASRVWLLAGLCAWKLDQPPAWRVDLIFARPAWNRKVALSLLPATRLLEMALGSAAITPTFKEGKEQ